VLRDMLMSKGGRDFAIACIDNLDEIVPERVRPLSLYGRHPPRRH